MKNDMIVTRYFLFLGDEPFCGFETIEALEKFTNKLHEKGHGNDEYTIQRITKRITAEQITL